MKKVDNLNYIILITISTNIILKIFLLKEFGDTELDNEWGVLFENLYYNGALSYRFLDDKFIPSVYMPPLYVYFIYCIKIIFPNNFDIVKLVLYCQIILSAAASFYFLKINLYFFPKKISFFSFIIFSFFPIYMYSNLQVSSVTLQVLLNILFFYFLVKIFKQKKFNINTFLKFGVICGLNNLLRGEFILLYFFTLFFLFFFKKINIKKLTILILTTLVILSPYLIRNYITFNKLTITNSFGYNLWKGNNIDSKVEGSETILAFSADGLKTKINEIAKDNFYEINYDNLFLKSSVNFIKKDPILFLKRYFQKFFSFLIIDFNSTYHNYYNFINICSLFIVSILFLVSLIYYLKYEYKYKNFFFNYLILYILFTVLIFSLFFILPRYKLMIIPGQLIIINIMLLRFFKNFKL